VISGNIAGIKKSIVERLEALIDQKTDTGDFAPIWLVEELCDITGKIGREVCVYITRGGEIIYVSLGQSDRVSLEAMTMRRSQQRLSTIRCIHTHPNSSAALSNVDIESLKRLRFDAMAAIGEKDGLPNGIQMAVLAVSEDKKLTAATHYAADVYKLPQSLWLEYIVDADKEVEHSTSSEIDEDKPERIMLIGKDQSSIEELARLADTAGGIVVHIALQKNARNLIGKGKIAELSLLAQAENIDLAIYDDELTAIEQRDTEEALGIPIIDRTTLILDIFAMRAASSEGKMQVELAQQKYRNSRLLGQGVMLSRLAGGIGTRGPGENKLESDRRHIRRRIHELRSQLDQLATQRELRRKRREKNEVASIALVGYTNSGKSTLLAKLSGTDVFIEDKLFATLDPLTRRCEIDNKVEVCITDTVGFIKKLPHHLIDAFRSTLEEAVHADLLLHICDGSSPEILSQIKAVDEVLEQINASDIKQIIVVNKIDAIKMSEIPFIEDAVYISAATGEGIDKLKDRIIKEIAEMRAEVEVLVPYNRGEVLASIYACANVLDTEHNEEGTKIKFTASKQEIERIKSKLHLLEEQENDWDN